MQSFHNLFLSFILRGCVNVSKRIGHTCESVAGFDFLILYHTAYLQTKKKKGCAVRVIKLAYVYCTFLIT